MNAPACVTAQLPVGSVGAKWKQGVRICTYIKMDLREIGWDGVDWTDGAQDRDQWRALVNTVLNLRVP
jgi:hypothetical protein